jgi:hypothetical protein
MCLPPLYVSKQPLSYFKRSSVRLFSFHGRFSCSFGLPPVSLTLLTLQYAAVKTYDYHPPMPSPDSEAPEQSLGDCAICMDAIRLEPSGRHQSEKGTSAEWDRDAITPSNSRRMSLGNPGGLLSAMHIGMESPGTRKIYSLAPCHHLFVSSIFLSWLPGTDSNCFKQHTECLERVCSICFRLSYLT